MRLRTNRSIPGLLGAACLIAAWSACAGEYHNGQQDTCSDCHVAHASKSGETWTPTQKLLKNSAGQVALCMTCHDGTDPHAPDIVAAGTAGQPSSVVTTQYQSKHGSAAGFFQGDYLGSANPSGHDLMPTGSVTAPLSLSYTKIGGLVCSDCHDPHGTPNYRNLLLDPNPKHPGSLDITVGTHVKEAVPVNAQSPNPALAYDTGNVSLAVPNNIGAWCADCHDTLATNATGSSPAHFKGHPSEVSIGDANAHADFANWLSGSQSANSGFGAAVGDVVAGIPRVRYGSPSGSNTITSRSDTVSCLSCHKAHGSKYRYGMPWPYHQTGADALSGCQQCHFK